MPYSPIPIHADYDWQQLELIDIIDSNEILEKIPNTKNLAQRPIYYELGVANAIDICVARTSVINKLKEAANLLPDNIGLLVLDAWRPREVQLEIQNQVRKVIIQRYPDMSEAQREQFLLEFVAPADSDFVSPHLTGGSVDVTLYDYNTEKCLHMGSNFDEPTERSYTRYYEYNNTDINACYNRRLLYYVMTKVGFSNLPTEWWHYDYGNQLWAYYSNKEHAIYNKANW